MTSITVGLGARAYEVEIGENLVEAAGRKIAPLLKRARVAVVSDANVWGLHGARLSAALAGSGITCLMPGSFRWSAITTAALYMLV